MAPMYYRNAQAAVVVYDITKAASLEKAKGWVKELQRQASAGIVIALAGNKLDLVEGEDATKERQVSEEEARNYAEEAGLLFLETSAKTSHNVQEIFTEIAKTIPEEQLNARTNRVGQNTGSQRGNNRINLSQGRGESARKQDNCAC